MLLKKDKYFKIKESQVIMMIKKIEKQINDNEKNQSLEYNHGFLAGINFMSDRLFEMKSKNKI